MNFLFGRAIWALRKGYVFNKIYKVRVSKIINVHKVMLKQILQQRADTA